MELKHLLLTLLSEVKILLIVPYGIETEEINNGVTVTVNF